jgi:hypothetical protein
MSAGLTNFPVVKFCVFAVTLRQASACGFFFSSFCFVLSFGFSLVFQSFSFFFFLVFLFSFCCPGGSVTLYLRGSSFSFLFSVQIWFLFIFLFIFTSFLRPVPFKLSCISFPHGLQLGQLY